MSKVSWSLFLACALVACGTRPNPEFCDSNEDCRNGTVCDLSTNRCAIAPDGAIDASTDAAPARCDSSAPFHEPSHEAPLSSSIEDEVVALTSNELVVFLQRQTPHALLLGSRFELHESFVLASSSPELDAIRNADGTEYHPAISADGLALYFHRSTQTSAAIHVATRAQSHHVFTEGQPVTVDGSSLAMIFPQLSYDGQTLYWFDYGDRKVYSASRFAANNFKSRKATTDFQVYRYVVSADELTLYYSDSQNNDIFRTTRASKDVPFSVGAPLGGVNSSANDAPLAISKDDCELYLQSSRPGGLGGLDIYIARRS